MNIKLSFVDSLSVAKYPTLKNWYLSPALVSPRDSSTYPSISLIELGFRFSKNDLSSDSSSSNGSNKRNFAFLAVLAST